MPACELTKKISNILVLYQILLIFAQKYIEMKIKEIQYIRPDLFAPKDAWDKLSMAEKSEMMKVAVRNGVTNLQEIRKKYNEFAEGGDKETPRPVTTGGAGYIPPAVDASWVANKLRNRLYRTINPLTDYNIRKNLAEVVSGNTMDYGDIHKDKEGNAYVDFEDATAPVEIVDDIWAKYLSIPENQRRFKTRIEESAYRPKMGGNENLSYYRLPLTDYEKDKLIEETNNLPIGKNKVTDLFSGYNLADHTIGRGIDARGEYRSYYDRWDINPFSGKYQGWDIPFLRNLPDTTMGIGKPVEIYDRIYLDDYYGVSESTHATYLPEVTVFSSKHKTPFEEMMEEMGRKAEGGKIHIKPSHRGRLTELKRRTGKTEAELYRTGNPATRKMITFARNARKWKHGEGGNLYPGGGFMGLMPIFVPAALRGIGNAVKERAYKTITPQSYNISKAAKEFISGKERNLNGIEPVRNEEWARYLGVPYEGESNFEPSPYRPTKGQTYDTVLKFKDESKILSDEVLSQMLERQKKTGKNSFLVTGNGGGLGSYTLSLGEDEKGKYISYYDDWDINPFKGINARTKIPFVSTIEDIVPGSNPFTVYGRRYYEKTNSKKHNFGGNLFSGEEELI